MGRVTPGLWRTPGERAPVWPGRNWPLGATWSEESTNFAVYAPAGDRRVRVHSSTRTATRCSTASPSRRWASGTARCPESGPAPATASGSTGPGTPSRGCASTPHKLLLDPFARAVSGEVALHPAIYGFDADDPTVTHETDSAPYVPRSVVVGRRASTGATTGRCAPLARQRDLRDARQGHDGAARPGAGGAARHVRRARDARRDRVPQGPRRHRRRAAADPPVRLRAGRCSSAG